jgi:hypothetical protein
LAQFRLIAQNNQLLVSFSSRNDNGGQNGSAARMLEFLAEKQGGSGGEGGWQAAVAQALAAFKKEAHQFPQFPLSLPRETTIAPLNRKKNVRNQECRQQGLLPDVLFHPHAVVRHPRCGHLPVELQRAAGVKKMPGNAL